MDLDLRRWLRTIKLWMDSALGSSRGSQRAESMISFVGSRSLLYIVLNFVFDLSLLDLFRLPPSRPRRRFSVTVTFSPPDTVNPP